MENDTFGSRRISRANCLPGHSIFSTIYTAWERTAEASNQSPLSSMITYLVHNFFFRFQGLSIVIIQPLPATTIKTDVCLPQSLAQSVK
jgi:hypothetical protein